MPAPASASSSFPVDPTLLHPSFESYKLIQSSGSTQNDSSEGEEALIQTHHPIPSYLSLSEITNPAGSILGHKDAKDRSLMSHLVPRIQPRIDEEGGKDSGMAAYVDSQGFLMLIVVDEHCQPSFHPLIHLEVTPSLASKSPSPPPPSSVLSLPENLWLVSLGDGVFSLVKSRSVPNALKPGSDSRRWTGDLLKQWKVVDEEQERSGSDSDSDSPQLLTAFRLLNADLVEGKKGSVQILIQSSRKFAVGVGRPQPGLGGSSSFNSAFSASVRDKSRSSRTAFDVSMLQIELPESKVSSTSIEKLKPKWTMTSEEPCFYAKSCASMGVAKHVICSEAGFVSKRRKLESPPASINKLEAVNSAQPLPTPPAQASTLQSSNSKAQPYSWHQTSDTVTVVFALPPFVSKEQIRSHFQSQSLSISISQEALHQVPSFSSLNVNSRFSEITDEENQKIDIGTDFHHHVKVLESLTNGHFKSRSLWGEIDIEGSLWTLEASGSQSSDSQKSASLLTLHLEKKYHGTRWSSVFSPKKRPTQRKKAATEQTQQQQADQYQDADDSNVPETMDPLELLNAVEGLDKYTASSEEDEVGHGMQNMADQMNSRSEGSGLAPEQASLLRDGLEEEDAEIGKPIVVSWITEDEIGEEAEVSRPSGDSFKKEMVLASSLAVAATAIQNSSRLLVIKHGLDGLAFSPVSDSPEQESWTHRDTLPALAFVLASKKDAHRIYVHSAETFPDRSHYANRKLGDGSEVGPSTILAFESPALTLSSSNSANRPSGSNGGAGNLFVYYSPPLAPSSSKSGRKRLDYSSSRVIRLGIDEKTGHGSGSLVGAAAVEVKGRQLLLCLCERSLLVLRNLL